jgi:signal transduction histidine kinase/ActR/RegA family two-component response regulator
VTVRVLIVDDNLDLAEGLAALLRARGSEAIVALDGDRGLQLSNQGPWDAALVDLKLPRRAGEEILRKLSTNGRPAHLYAMTGYESPRRLAAVEALDIDGVLRKPFDVGSLLATLVPGEAPVARSEGRVALLGDGPPDLDATSVATPEALTELVLAEPLDAVVVPAAGPDVDELVEDLHVLDRELAVVRSHEPSILEAAVDRTREARRRAAEHAVLERAFSAAPSASLLIGGAPPAILRWTREAEALLGWSAQELAKLQPDDLDEPGSVRIHTLIEGANGDGSWTPCVARVRGGELRPVYAHAMQVGDEMVLLNLKARDDRGSHEEALQLLGATAAGVAHEMRNAMASVGSSLAILHARLDKDSHEYGILGGIRARVDRASEVMNDLLAFARPVELRLKTVPATMFLTAVANQLRDCAPEGIDIVTEIPDPTLRILIDPARVQMALLNLGTNALLALGDQGTVTLRCERRSSWIELTVRDDGPGIPEALRTRIFQPFFTTRAQGTGLGLANVRKLVQAHGGRIQLLDDGPGASFLIRLPPRPEVMEVPA